MFVVLVESWSELLGADPTRTEYSVAPLTAFHSSVTTVPWMPTRRRFAGTHDACGVGCDDVVVGVEEGPVGAGLAPSEPPHAPVTAAASTIRQHSNPVHSLRSLRPLTLLRRATHSLDSLCKMHVTTCSRAMPVPRTYLGYILWPRSALPWPALRVHRPSQHWGYEFGGSRSESSTRFRDPGRS